jgi:hypothetical protein
LYCAGGGLSESARHSAQRYLGVASPALSTPRITARWPCLNFSHSASASGLHTSPKNRTQPSAPARSVRPPPGLPIRKTLNHCNDINNHAFLLLLGPRSSPALPLRWPPLPDHAQATHPGSERPRTRPRATMLSSLPDQLQLSTPAGCRTRCRSPGAAQLRTDECGLVGAGSGFHASIMAADMPWGVSGSPDP